MYISENMKNLINKEICPFCDKEMVIDKIKQQDKEDSLVYYKCDCGWEDTTRVDLEKIKLKVDNEIQKTDILNLKNMYETHSSKRIVTLSVGKDKITHISKTGVVTPTGEYPYDVWEKLLLEQASKLNETYIIDKLKKYSLNLPWIKKEKKAYEKALALYSRRIFEDKKWVGFEDFKKELNTK